MLYDISEIFYSLQGEGLMQGVPTVFVRMAGCNLRCSFCDTKYAWKAGRPMESRDIVLEALRHPCRRVCITGGEPFLQKLSPLVKALQSAKCIVSAETNGTIWQKLPLDWLTVSPKAGGLKFHPRGYDRRFRTAASEFKYVLRSAADTEFIDPEIKLPVILQPVDNDGKTAKMIVEFLQGNPGRNRYLRMQLHKTAGIK